MTSPALKTRTIYHPIQQDYATFVELVEETGRSLIEVEVAPGGGNDPHRHLSYAEHFEVIEGELIVQLGSAKHRLAPGESAVAPVGAWHCFRNETDSPTRFMVELRPGHRGMEMALQVAYGLAMDGEARADGSPRNILHSALLIEWADVRPSGPLRLIVPIMKPLAALARRRGVDEELRSRYVRF
jgi:quercetin dioxygenase-like cupin family protein